MFNMFTFVIALVIAQVLAGVVMLTLVLNPKVMGWFMKKVHEMINEVSEDLIDLV